MEISGRSEVGILLENIPWGEKSKFLANPQFMNPVLSKN